MEDSTGKSLRFVRACSCSYLKRVPSWWRRGVLSFFGFYFFSFLLSSRDASRLRSFVRPSVRSFVRLCSHHAIIGAGAGAIPSITSSSVASAMRSPTRATKSSPAVWIAPPTSVSVARCSSRRRRRRAGAGAGAGVGANLGGDLTERMTDGGSLQAARR